MKRRVLSAGNLRKGGTLTILRPCLSFLSEWAPKAGYEVVALVHRRELAYYPSIQYIELPWAADSWLKRLWCEYHTMGKISQELGEGTELWLSLHDTTPRVKALRQAVYCQTSFPFMKWRLRDFSFDPKIPLFTMLTKFAYRIGIHRNRYLVVQQRWLREGFSRMFGINEAKFIVAPPPRKSSPPQQAEGQTTQGEAKPFTFLFASTPDVHKNFELLASASQILENKLGKGTFETIFTLSGEENKYARWLRENWGGVASLRFAGFQAPTDLQALYARTDCLVFPSRVETWGLPISEFMPYDRPMLLANQPYAHETSAGAGQVAYFDTDNAEALASMMERAIQRDPELFHPNPIRPTAPPLALDWQELFTLLLS